MTASKGDAVYRLLGSDEKLHVDSDVRRTYVLASERDDWKARAEKAESALAASGPNAEAWEKWQADFKREVEAMECWKARAEKAEDELGAAERALTDTTKELGRVLRERLAECGYSGWKARAEKAEAKVDELSLELARTWTRLWSSEAACAEMRAAVEQLYDLIPNPGPELLWETQQAQRRAWPIVKRALSSDAGKGWVSPEEHRKAVKEANDAGFDEAWAQREKDLYEEGWRPREGWAPPEVVAQALKAMELTWSTSDIKCGYQAFNDAMTALREVAK